APGAHVYRLVREGRGIGGLYRMWRTCRLQSCFGAVVGIIRPPYPMTASLSRHSSSAILLTSLRLSPAFWSALADSVPGARASLRAITAPALGVLRRSDVVLEWILLLLRRSPAEQLEPILQTVAHCALVALAVPPWNDALATRMIDRALQATERVDTFAGRVFHTTHLVMAAALGGLRFDEAKVLARYRHFLESDDSNRF